VPILYRFGFVGLVLFGALLVGFGLRSLRLSLSGGEEQRYVGLVLLITITLTAIMTVWGPTFMDPIISFGLWPFAWAAAEALRPACRRSDELSRVSGQAVERAVLT
jgi:O-antigen ligase